LKAALPRRQTFAGVHLRANPFRRFNIAQSDDPRPPHQGARVRHILQSSAAGRRQRTRPQDRHNSNHDRTSNSTR
jgi:hypothetical protein